MRARIGLWECCAGWKPGCCFRVISLTTTVSSESSVLSRQFVFHTLCFQGWQKIECYYLFERNWGEVWFLASLLSLRNVAKLLADLSFGKRMWMHLQSYGSNPYWYLMQNPAFLLQRASLSFFLCLLVNCGDHDIQRHWEMVSESCDFNSQLQCVVEG